MADRHSVELDSFKAWAKDVMTLRRLKQIRSAFHPEPGFALDGDTCHQLRYIINNFNDTAMHTFIPGIEMSFDKGVILLRSRMNPVWKYNNNKPNKCRVVLFVLANNSEKKYFFEHMDLYRGQNAETISIPDCICKFPTTQKVSFSFCHINVNIQYETFALMH